MIEPDNYEVTSKKDRYEDGHYYTAVKTTGIYCLPTCKAKTPNKENVEYFKTVLEAEAAGYRPCKRCIPNVDSVNWRDYKKYIDVVPPQEFSFEECLVYLNRSDTECLHKVKGGELYKLLKIEDWKVLFKIGTEATSLRVSFLNDQPPKWVRGQIAKYIWDLFDFDTDIRPFYKMALHDDVLHPLVGQFKGLRIVKMNDIFECLTWAIMGQQINLKFAYTLKKRFVEKYGEKIHFDGEDYFLFPTAEVISMRSVEDLKSFQFTTRKAEYVLEIARICASGGLRKEELALIKDYELLKKRIVSIRGIGNWTADYTIMKCFHQNCAFPLADVGIHNALKGILKREEKPSLQEIIRLAENWKGWESYAAFYIWRYLYE